MYLLEVFLTWEWYYAIVCNLRLVKIELSVGTRSSSSTACSILSCAISTPRCLRKYYYMKYAGVESFRKRMIGIKINFKNVVGFGLLQYSEFSKYCYVFIITLFELPNLIDFSTQQERPPGQSFFDPF